MKTMPEFIEPKNAVEGLATVKRLISCYDRLTPIAIDTLREDMTEWEGDPTDLLYQTQTLILRRISRLVHQYDLKISVGAGRADSVDTSSTKSGSGEPNYRDITPDNSDDVLETANRLVRHAEALTDIAAAVGRENPDEFEHDAQDQIYHAKETLLHAATDLTPGFDDLTIRIVKRPGKGAA